MFNPYDFIYDHRVKTSFNVIPLYFRSIFNNFLRFLHFNFTNIYVITNKQIIIIGYHY